MKKHWMLIVSLFGFLVSCTKDNKPTLCGADQTFDLYKAASLRDTGPFRGLFLDTSDHQFATYMEGNNRVFQWCDLVENACPDEHVRVTCKVDVRDIPCPFTVRGEIWVSAVLQPGKIIMSQAGGTISGQAEEGLKQVYGDGPGKFVPLLEIVFPSQGSFTADSLLFFQEVNNLWIKAEYSAYSI